MFIKTGRVITYFPKFVSEGIDINKTNVSKECDICCY